MIRILCLTILVSFSHINLNFAQENLEPVELSNNLYSITNSGGGNIVFLITKKGVVVVDAGGSPGNAQNIIQAIKSKTDSPIKYLIYTHSHRDHIYGVSEFPDDIKIIAHQNIVDNLKNYTEPGLKNSLENTIPEYLEGLKSQIENESQENSDDLEKVKQQYNLYSNYLKDLKKVKIRYPDITFTDSYKLKLKNERIFLEYPGPGHTNDNIVVKFSNHNVIHTGDLIFNGSVPYVITDHGANVENWINIVDDLYIENIKTVVPGHGEITDKEVFKDQANYFRKLTYRVEALKNAGFTVNEIKEKIDFEAYKMIDGGNQFPVNIEVIYNEL
ncbi:MAG: MBL fold metallo-hydrolase [Bacteroidales bacterium]